MKKTLLLSLLLLQEFIAFSQLPEVNISGSQIRKFTSKIVNGQEYVLQIALPAGYGKTDKKYPLVVLMDSQWDFPLLTAIYGEQYYDGFIPEFIIVGITWGGSYPNADSLRARDYTPTNEKRLLQSGGANKFLSVIKDEIFPIIESNYRVDVYDKTLMGCSLGGLFTLYTMFTHANMFNRYIAASPSFMWDNGVLYKYEEQYHSNTLNPPAKLFMCVGGVELSATQFTKFSSFLINRKHSNLQMETKILENTGHSGTKAEGYARGLQFVFKRDSLQLSSSILDQYKGTYRLKDGTNIEIKTDDSKLVASSGYASFQMIASSKTDFYLTSSFLNIHFMKDDTGNITGFQLNRYGSTVFAEKLR